MGRKTGAVPPAALPDAYGDLFGTGGGSILSNGRSATTSNFGGGVKTVYGKPIKKIGACATGEENPQNLSARSIGNLAPFMRAHA